MKTIVAFILLCFFAFNVSAQSDNTEPQFKDYSADVYAGKFGTVNLKSHKLGRMYRTSLRDSAKDGITFAGHYNIARIGCGTACFIAAIIDARTGNVYFPTEFYGWGVALGEWAGDEDPLQYKADSTLLRVMGAPNLSMKDPGNHGENGLYYYEWKNNKLKLVKFIPK